MKHLQNLLSDQIIFLMVILLSLVSDVGIQAATSYPESSLESSWMIDVTQDADGRRLQTAFQTAFKAASFSFDGNVAIRYSLPGDTGSPSAGFAGMSLPILFSGRFIFPGMRQMHVGAFRLRNFAEELFVPLKLARSFRKDIPFGDFFGVGTDISSLRQFLGVTMEFHIDWKLLGSPVFGLAVGYPSWTGRRPWVALFLMQSRFQLCTVSIGGLAVHAPYDMWASDGGTGSVDGASPVISSPSVDWSVIYPSRACVMLGKIDMDAFSVAGLLVRTGISVRLGMDLSLGFGFTHGMWLEARRQGLVVEIQWKKDRGGFQFSRPIGLQQRPVEILRLASRHELSWLLTEFQYEDELYVVSVHGGQRQRRKVEVRTSFTIQRAGRSYGLSVDDATTWFADGRRKGVRAFSLKVRLPIEGVPLRFSGEVKLLRGDGSQPDLFQSYKIVIDVGDTRIQWDDDSVIISLERSVKFSGGGLVFRIDSKRRLSMKFSFVV